MFEGVGQEELVTNRGVVEGHLPALEFPDRVLQTHILADQQRRCGDLFSPFLGQRDDQTPGASTR